MKSSYFALAICSLCLNLGSYADSLQNTLVTQALKISPEDAEQLAQELLEPFKDGFQLEDLITISSILDTHFTKKNNLSILDKRQALKTTLNKIINKRNFPPYEKEFLEKFVPALAFIVFPDSIDDSLSAPTNPSPSEQEILTAANSFIKKLHKTLSWKDIPSCILFTCQFATSYPGLTSEEKGYLAKKLLGQIIDKTDTPFLPDTIFDEVFKRVGYPLIDYLVSKN